MPGGHGAGSEQRGEQLQRGGGDELGGGLGPAADQPQQPRHGHQQQVEHQQTRRRPRQLQPRLAVVGGVGGAQHAAQQLLQPVVPAVAPHLHAVQVEAGAAEGGPRLLVGEADAEEAQVAAVEPLLGPGLRHVLGHRVSVHGHVCPVVGGGGDGHGGDGGEGRHAPAAEDEQAAALRHGLVTCHWTSSISVLCDHSVMFVPATADNWLLVVVAAGHLYLTPRDLASCNWADHRHLTTGITRNNKLAALKCVVS